MPSLSFWTSVRGVLQIHRLFEWQFYALGAFHLDKIYSCNSVGEPELLKNSDILSFLLICIIEGYDYRGFAMCINTC